MSVLCCGPFAQVGKREPDAPAAIRAPLYTQGDWQGTPEGQQALQQSIAKIQQAEANGTLPKGTHVEMKNPDTGVVVVPFDSWGQAVTASTSVKENVLSITGAGLQDGLVLANLPSMKKK